MPLDSNSLCPGGHGKKIRHCCPDLTKELQRIESQLSGGQFAAAVSSIETIEKDHPNCACLMAIKCTALRAAGQLGPYAEAAQKFVNAEPNNPQALGEWAIATALGGDVVEALRTLIRAYETGEQGKLHSSLFGPTMVLASCLADSGKESSAIALLKILRQFDPQNPETALMLRRIYSAPGLPLFVKEPFFDRSAPESWLGTARYNTALSALAMGHWHAARTILEELTDYAAAWPNLWRTLAVARLWLCDEVGSSDAFARFARAAGVPFDDAVDAEILVNFAREEDDLIDTVQATYEITGEDRLLEALLSRRDIINVPFDPRLLGDADHPAPSHIFHILDRPVPADDVPISLATAPRRLARVLLYGRQTDRAARIEIAALEPNMAAGIERLTALAGDSFKAGATAGTAGAMAGIDDDADTVRQPTTSWLAFQLHPEFDFGRAETRLTGEIVKELSRDFFAEVFLPAWMDHPAADLDGKTPRQAVDEEFSPIRLSAAATMVCLQLPPANVDFANSLLHEKLRLSAPAALSAPQGDSEAARFFAALPIWRWNRVEPSSYSPAVASRLLPTAHILGQTSTILLLARRILDAPAPAAGDAAAFTARLMAYDQLIDEASANDTNLDGARELLKRAYEEARLAGASDGALNLKELTLFLADQNIEGFQRMLAHIAQAHRAEPEVIQALEGMLIQLGLINPDGTPRVFPSQGGAPMGAAAMGATDASAGGSMGGMMGGAQEQSSSGLWTPDSDRPSGSGGGKLWIPD